MVFYSGRRREILDSLRCVEVLALQLGTGGGERKGSTMPELMAGVVTSRAGVDTG